MFVQVIQGRVGDAGRLRARMDQWVRDLSAGAIGWLGSTAGVTADGTAVAVARFESADAARRNSERPEQDAWWSETSKVFDGEVRFLNSTEVDVDVQGDPDRAGFVQVIQGRGTDPARARELMNQDSDRWAEFRPEVLGSLAIGHEGGAYTMVLYFTSEAEAREGERKEPPPDLRAQMEEMDKLSIGEPEFFDLKQPLLASPD